MPEYNLDITYSVQLVVEAENEDDAYRKFMKMKAQEVRDQLEYEDVTITPVEE